MFSSSMAGPRWGRRPMGRPASRVLDTAGIMRQSANDYRRRGSWMGEFTEVVAVAKGRSCSRGPAVTLGLTGVET